jgi:hypothetical protein
VPLDQLASEPPAEPISRVSVSVREMQISSEFSRDT